MCYKGCDTVQVMRGFALTAYGNMVQDNNLDDLDAVLRKTRASHTIDTERLASSLVPHSTALANEPVIGFVRRWVREASSGDAMKFVSFVTGGVVDHDLQVAGEYLRVDVSANSTHHLPQARTCVITLIVPRYPTYAVLKEKLEQALGAAPAFGFI